MGGAWGVGGRVEEKRREARRGSGDGRKEEKGGAVGFKLTRQEGRRSLRLFTTTPPTTATTAEGTDGGCGGYATDVATSRRRDR